MRPEPRRCTGVILAGGANARYGGLPKGLEPLGGARMIDRLAAALRPVTDDLLLVANAPEAGAWLPGVRTVSDLRPGAGALGGLHAALAHADGDVLVVAWDMPFVPATLLGALRALGEAGDADAVLPAHAGSPRGVEPLCAWYGARCRPAIEAALDAGDHRMVAFHDAVRVRPMPADAVARFGAPAVLFANVNTPEAHAAWTAALAPARALPPMLAVVGKQGAGKTTLLVRLAAALTQRGRRVMTLKHSSHTFDLDPEGKDTYRHFHEGGAVRAALASPDRFGLVARWDAEPAPEALVAQHLADADLVLCEGYKTGALPKLEVFRRAVHPTSLFADGVPHPHTWRGLVTDTPDPTFPGAVFDLAASDWADALADWVTREYLSPVPR